MKKCTKCSIRLRGYNYVREQYLKDIVLGRVDFCGDLTHAAALKTVARLQAKGLDVAIDKDSCDADHFCVRVTR